MAIKKRVPSAFTPCMNRRPMAINNERTTPARMDVVMGTSGNKKVLISGTIKTGKIKLRITKGNLPVHSIAYTPINKR